MDQLSRRQFLEFMGVTTIGLSGLGLLSACRTSAALATTALPFEPLPPQTADQLSLARGFSSQMIASWGMALNNHGDTFGFNCDYLAYFPLPKDRYEEGVLWVNHEAINPIFVSGYVTRGPRTQAQVDMERKVVGGSLMHIRKENDQWTPVFNSQFNRRISGETVIPFVSSGPIKGRTSAVGTLGNCAGGVTPWKTVLTCEENFQDYYAEPGKQSLYGWEMFYPLPPEHYGWVVEVNPFTGAAKKLTGLGRMAHECATTIVAEDGRCVVYTSDDLADQCLYKFISSEPGSLHSGTLYVADINKGQWLPLDIEKSSVLKSRFSDQLDMLIHTREAADLVGGSKLDRPEDIEIHPTTKAVFVTLTNNAAKKNYFGSILKIEEDSADPLSLTFKASTFLAGGPATGFACPDNLAFDGNGDLWMTTDIKGEHMHKDPYTEFANNGLFYIPMSGNQAGRAFQVAAAPTDAELTGPVFAPDGQTLFLSVQHPGELSPSVTELTSHWPEGGNAIPRSSVVAIRGPIIG